MNLEASRLPKTGKSPLVFQPDTPFEISAIEHLVKDLVMLAQPTANGLCRDAGKMLDHAVKLGDKKR
ncbi:hypothetical protein PGQ11_013367 [Apiospora arundinis]|uniref:Uncharacterized protein n=1 Tax=Apiospora arundinis TaxID=335852 RepID=A0ABR2HPH4_9PEZI